MKQFDDIDPELKHLVEPSGDDLLVETREPAKLDLDSLTALSPRESRRLAQEIENNDLAERVLGVQQESVLRVEHDAPMIVGAPVEKPTRKATDDEFVAELRRDIETIARKVEAGEPPADGESPEQLFQKARTEIGVATLDQMIAVAESVDGDLSNLEVLERDGVLASVRIKSNPAPTKIRRAATEFLRALRDGDFQAARTAARSAE